MGVRGKNPTNKLFNSIADKIAQSRGWKDHADALAHRDKDGKVGYGPNYKGQASK